jgi:Putative phage serine protease XkdF
MCLSCSCVLAGTGQPDDEHGDPDQITLADIVIASGLNNVDPAELVATIAASLQVAMPGPAEVAKGQPEQKFVLGVAYQPGRDDRITKGVDGGRDFFTEAELEKACWSFMQSDQQHGMFHMPGTEGAAQPVENYIYRNPIPWVVPVPGGDPVVVRKGTWVLGAILDDPAWDLAKQGKVNGWSPQGVARRRTTRRTRN